MAQQFLLQWEPIAFAFHLFFPLPPFPSSIFPKLSTPLRLVPLPSFSPRIWDRNPRKHLTACMVTMASVIVRRHQTTERRLATKVILNSPKWEIFPKCCIFGRKFTNRLRFRGNRFPSPSDTMPLVQRRKQATAKHNFCHLIEHLNDMNLCIVAADI